MNRELKLYTFAQESFSLIATMFGQGQVDIDLYDVLIRRIMTSKGYDIYTMKCEVRWDTWCVVLDEATFLFPIIDDEIETLEMLRIQIESVSTNYFKKMNPIDWRNISDFRYTHNVPRQDLLC